MKIFFSSVLVLLFTISIIAQQRQIAVTIDDLPVVSADAGQLRQVLNNLVSNSIKYSAPGTMVEITIEKKDKYVIFSVRDQGQGIPQNELSHVFILCG